MAQTFTGRSWELNVDQEWIDVTSSSPTPNERWTFTDTNGHEHRYDSGYPTLEMVVDESHWCDGNEGLTRHDPHEQVDEAHYECRTCREIIEPKMDPPYTPKHIPGMKSATLTGYRSDGLKVTAALNEVEVNLVTSPEFNPTDRGIALILDGVDDHRLVSIEFSR